MRRRHRMPFGAEVQPGGGVRFRLWAPAAHTVALCLEQRPVGGERAMDSVGGGWFELSVESAQAGSRYRYRIDGGLCVPDPASRCNPDDVHEASEVIDPAAFDWGNEPWRGRPWAEAVIYELHVGCFTPEGTFAGVARRLDYLAELGVTALELMPVADFPGRRNWGYDGVLPFAPDSRYGRPEELKTLIRAAHERGLMVLLDVVYNHFGPEGNYLGLYATPFFDAKRRTPWGAAINFDGVDSRTVRDFFRHNALYWLEEFHFDGLRFDAVHAICDASEPDILVDIARAVRAGSGRERHIHLLLENDHNAARYLRPDRDATLLYDAQWNDDLHHALHVLLTGEVDGYYSDYAEAPIRHLGRCLAEGFAWQGEPSPYRGGMPRGEPSVSLPPSAFVSFLQNHDQIGNRAFGERIVSLSQAPALAAAEALLLLAPAPPLLFMGEEFGSAQPFLFFCDFAPELMQAVRRGRRQEFARFKSLSACFSSGSERESVPDPGAEATFLRSRIDWSSLDDKAHRSKLARTRALLALRRREIVPLLTGMRGCAVGELFGERGLVVRWTLGDGSGLWVVANFGDRPACCGARPSGRALYATPEAAAAQLAHGALPPWSVVWLLDRGETVACAPR